MFIKIDVIYVWTSWNIFQIRLLFSLRGSISSQNKLKMITEWLACRSTRLWAKFIDCVQYRKELMSLSDSMYFGHLEFSIMLPKDAQG